MLTGWIGRDVATTAMSSGWFLACVMVCYVDSMPATMEFEVKFMEVNTVDCTVGASVEGT